jgi:hypothetical protein
LLVSETVPFWQSNTCVVPFASVVCVPFVTATVVVPALAPQHVGSLKVTGVMTGAPAAEYTAVTVQLPPFPLEAGNVQFRGLVKGALKVTEPPQEFVMVNVPLAGKQPVVNVPDST